jgi:2-C-methyl-D-erythritol 4-phosphate cytidylyltransferase
VSATWALEAAGVTPLGHGVSAKWLAGLEETFVLHDPLCPMTPPDFIADCVAQAIADDVVVAAFRPVTDTIKVLDGDRIGGTVDRDQLLALTSPVVVPPGRLGELPDLDYDAVSLTQLVSQLSGVRFKEAPALGARVQTEVDLLILEAISQPASRE